jgi:hypothetical protein
MRKTLKYQLIILLVLLAKNSMSQNFTEPIIVNSNNYGPKLILNDPNTANKVPIEFRTNNIIKWELGLRPISNGNDMALWNNYNGTYFPIMWFKHENRFVGIGTDNPIAKLQIESSGSIYVGNPTLLIRDLTSRGTMFLESVTDNPTDFVFKNNGIGRVWLSSRGSNENYDFRLYTNPNNASYPEINALVIKQNGNIGIGTNPLYKLDVKGTIRSCEVIVNTENGCDFVFKSNYKLMDLKKLENFVKTNEHLPEIPSEKEMIENGVNMKEFQMKLLQKIEELTLYTIEQNKKLEQQNQEIIELKKQSKAIEELKQIVKLQSKKIEKIEAASK